MLVFGVFGFVSECQNVAHDNRGVAIVIGVPFVIVLVLVLG